VLKRKDPSGPNNYGVDLVFKEVTPALSIVERLIRRAFIPAGLLPMPKLIR